jgi:hypothetical protein
VSAVRGRLGKQKPAYGRIDGLSWLKIGAGKPLTIDRPNRAEKVLNLFRRGRDPWAGCERHIPQTGEIAMTRTMIRKLTIALGAATVVAAAAVSPTAASAAGGWHGHHHGHHGWHGGGFRVGFYAPAYAAADCYVVRRVVYTPYGKRYRRVTVCN